MKVCNKYYFIEPIKNIYKDFGDRDILKININGESNRYTLAIIGDNGIPEMIRISIHGLRDASDIPQERLDSVQQISNHMLAILRTSYDSQISFFKAQAWNFREEDQKPELNMRMELNRPNVPLSADYIESSFTSTWSNRYLINLLSEGLNERIPLYYRYLALYRILEMRFKKNSSWDEEIYHLIDNFNEKFVELSISNMTLIGYIETTRNRCAHGKYIYKRNDELGITSLDYKALSDLKAFFPLMIEIIFKCINEHEETLGKFTISLE
jgi:hypothetical protein